MLTLTGYGETAADEDRGGAASVRTDIIMKAARGIEERPPARIELLGSVGGNDSCGAEPADSGVAESWRGCSILEHESIRSVLIPKRFFKCSYGLGDADFDAGSRSYLSKPLFTLKRMSRDPSKHRGVGGLFFSSSESV